MLARPALLSGRSIDSADPLRRNVALIVQRLRTCVNGRYAGQRAPYQAICPRGGGLGGHSLTELEFFYILMYVQRGKDAHRPAHPLPYPQVPPYGAV